MQFLLRACALMLCLLFTRSAQGQDLTRTIEFVTDTEAVHFDDYWRRVNDAALTENGRARLESGETRLSLRAMSNPARYGLIAPERVDEVLTAADLLCDNRESGSLQLRCRMPGESRSRRVRLTEANCMGHPDLFTLIPDGCEHPYVLTVEGRAVTLNRLTVPALPAPPVATEQPPTEPPSADEARELRAEVERLQGQIQTFQADQRESQRERREDGHRLERTYLALLALVILVIATVAVIWYQHRKLKTSTAQELALTAQVRGLSEAGSQLYLRTSKEAAEMQRYLADRNVDLYSKAATVIGALNARNQALETELAKVAKGPSVIIDQSAFEAAEIAAEAELRARESEQSLRAAQTVERQRLQDQIQGLQRQNDELRAEAERLRAHNRAQIATHEQHQAVVARNYRELEQQLFAARESVRDAEAKVSEYAATNARIAGQRAGIEDEKRQVKLANHALKHRLQLARQHLEELGLDIPDFLVMSPSDRLSIPTPPSTRTAPPPSRPPSTPPTDVTTDVIGMPPAHPPEGPSGAVTTGRQTLTGIGDEHLEQGPPRDTLRLTAEAGPPSPTPKPENPHRALTTPPPPNYLHVDAVASPDRWDIPPSPSGPRGDRELDERHPPLQADTGDRTGLWIMSHDERGLNGETVSLVPIPRPDPLPVIQEEPPSDAQSDASVEGDRTDPQRPTASIFHAPTRPTSLVGSERIIARTNKVPDP